MKKLLLFVFAALAFAACTQDVVVDITPAPILDNAPETLVVGFEDDNTRIQLQNGKTVWNSGDLVSVFYLSNANQKWQYTGETGNRTAELKRVDAGTATRELDNVVVVYPYNEAYYINPKSCNIKASLPAVQSYLEDSYGLGGNIMISQSEYNQFSLKSVCGWLKLQLTGNGEKISSITLRGNNGEQVAGELYINSADATALLAADMGSADDNNAGGSLIFDDTIIKEVTLDCGEGVTLGKSATAFYIALPPQTFTQGLTVEITDDSGYTMTQATDKVIAIERNTIQPMAAIGFVNPNTPAQSTPANNQIWYTAKIKAEPNYTDKSAFGADVISNAWDSETGKGIITFDGNVTMVGNKAFYNCDSFITITLPDSVTTIGNYAFYRCYSLTSVNIPDGVTMIGESAFYYCDSLTSVNIPNSVTTIGEEAFFRCDSLTSVNIPNSVTTIGSSAFYNCISLTSVNIPNSVTTIGSSAFYNCDSLTSVNIPESVTTIGKSAFYSCDNLTSVTIPDSVTTIGYEAFAGCSNLREFTGKYAADGGRCLIIDNTIIAYAEASGTTYNIPDSVTTIGSYAFADCDNLTSVNIPDSVTTIGERAFYNCGSLTSVTIGNSVTTIGYEAFYECYSLTSVNIPDSVTTIEDSAFYSCYSLTSATIGNSVTTIGYWAFDGCDSFTSVNIPDSVTTIGAGAFADCSSLKEFTGKYAADGGRCLIIDNTIIAYAEASGTTYNIPDSVTTIGDYAFNACISLTSVNIPDSVTRIGYEAFAYCFSLKYVYCKPTTPPALGGSNVFDNNASGRRIIVPIGSGEAYKTAEYWSEYANDIFEDEF